MEIKAPLVAGTVARWFVVYGILALAGSGYLAYAGFDVATSDRSGRGCMDVIPFFPELVGGVLGLLAIGLALSGGMHLLAGWLRLSRSNGGLLFALCLGDGAFWLLIALLAGTKLGLPVLALICMLGFAHFSAARYVLRAAPQPRASR